MRDVPQSEPPDIPVVHSARERRRNLILVLSAIVFTFEFSLLVGILVPTAVQIVDTPKSEALAYMRAIEAGDAERALDLTDEFSRPEGPGRARTDFLTDAVLRGAAERISDVEVVFADRDRPSWRHLFSDGHGSVQVRYTLGGKRQEATLDYVKKDGRWRLQRGIASMLYASCFGNCEALRVTVSGADFPVSGGGEVENVALFPAVYTAEAAVGPGYYLERRSGRDGRNTSVLVDWNITDASVRYDVEPDQ